MQSRVVSKPKIEVIWNSVVVEAYGDRIMGELKVNNLLTGEVSDLQVAGLFFAIGHEPQASGLRPQPANKFLDGQLQLDSDGLCSHFSLIRVQPTPACPAFLLPEISRITSTGKPK
ncbi:hypothetical protein V6N12_021900 [Hibiscus sabdariffa]|uniref:Uncharacterized protein n=1 Tax=Hibiscus sabdariffa TaxID=183260 RepID=A0ABR2FT26_9ROSI